MISPLGKGHRGRAHEGSNNTALDGYRGSGSGGGDWGCVGAAGSGCSWVGADDRGRGVLAHPRSEGMSPTSLHHCWAGGDQI